jgi:hypothetical protein
VVNPGRTLTPNWHIDCICYRLEGLTANEAANRLVINLPPRTLKSHLISICLPAWLLGRNPGARICASYAVASEQGGTDGRGTDELKPRKPVHTGKL